MQFAKRIIKAGINATGYKISRIDPIDYQAFPAELTPEDRAVYDYVRDNSLTMSTPERMYATLMSCRHVVLAKIPGAFVECGVWRGGNSILAADVFKRLDAERHVYLYDTFAGMTEPTDDDVSLDGTMARVVYQQTQQEGHNGWAFSPLADVHQNFQRYRLLTKNIHFVQGDVLASLSDAVELPQSISVLRLDTDWYESTRKELEVLYPLLSPGGILMVDDYGHWGGARKAVDEYFSSRPAPFLQYIDYTGRIGIKPSGI